MSASKCVQTQTKFELCRRKFSTFLDQIHWRVARYRLLRHFIVGSIKSARLMLMTEILSWDHINVGEGITLTLMKVSH
jgi:hypothetical protein